MKNCAINRTITSGLLLIVLVSASQVRAQRADSYAFTESITIISPATPITLSAPATAIAVAIEQQQQWPANSQTGRMVIAGQQAKSDTVILSHDAHANAPTSALVVFPRSTTTLTLLDFTPGTVVTLHLVYAKPLTMNTTIQQWRTLADDCGKPPVIPVGTWRTGLTPPKDRPVATAVRFVIVHHAEGSNTATDYVNVVRSIYVYHTQSNGWNDVGYNFLIAQDGTVFEGRDGQGLLDGDNVQGAHFCGNNGGTMGICLLGGYMTAQPTDAAMAALTKLTAWKLNKENGIQPIGSAFHAPSGKTLATISTHRDGSCATNCPGDNLYARLNQLRTAVASQTCVTAGTTPTPPTVIVPTVLATDPGPEPFALFPNPAQNGQFTIEHSRVIVAVIVTDATGRVVSATITRQNPGRWLANIPTWPTPHLLVTLRDDTGALLTQRVLGR